MSRIVITGMGLISAIGDSVKENRDSLINERTGIGHIRFYHTAHAGKLPTAEVKHSTEILSKKILRIPDPAITRTGLFALHAVEEAIHDSALTKEELSSGDTALVGATTVGGMYSPMNFLAMQIQRIMARPIFLPTIMRPLPWPSRSAPVYSAK